MRKSVGRRMFWILNFVVPGLVGQEILGSTGGQPYHSRNHVGASPCVVVALPWTEMGCALGRLPCGMKSCELRTLQRRIQDAAQFHWGQQQTADRMLWQLVAADCHSSCLAKPGEQKTIFDVAFQWNIYHVEA